MTLAQLRDVVSGINLLVDRGKLDEARAAKRVLYADTLHLIATGEVFPATSAAIVLELERVPGLREVGR